MKKVLALAVVAVMVFSLSAPAFAKTPTDKLTRGVANVLTGVLEVPQTIGQEWQKSDNFAIGAFCGLFKGIVQAVIRTGSGAWDILTFPLALPKDYEPLYHPDYVFDVSEADRTGSK
ncbi:MAG TPA: hypothetical protein DCL35_04405 [Candidatus Omnitrophica bacterium]|nr:hypothetical protein [Candidatus Omnitrophota bacterium]